jgi:hypothetical protein
MKKNSIKVPYRPIWIWLIILGYTICGLLNIAASTEVIKVTAEVDKAVITIGDRIIYSLIIQYEKQLKIQQPGPGANLGQFEIKDYTIYDPREINGMIQQKFDYEISVFDTGKFIIPPFPVAFAETDTSREYQIIESSPLEIYVRSVLIAGDQEIRDIKPPQNVPLNYRKWILIGIIAVIIMASLIFFLYYLRIRKQGRSILKKEVIRPAHEIALEQIGTLMENWRQMLKNNNHKQLFTEISQILRQYMENRYFIKALEETTLEIGWSINQLELENQLQQAIMDILEFSDLVKFAKFVPTEDETQECLQNLADFIKSTQLVFDEEEKNGLADTEKHESIELEPDLKTEQKG